MPKAKPEPFTDTASEFLRALRGKRAQTAFARFIGYRGNPATDWECGRRFPTAEEAFRICALTGVDVASAFRSFHQVPPPEVSDGKVELVPWMRMICGTTSVPRLAQGVGRSRFALSRWLKGEAQPRLPDFFALVNVATGRLAELIARLVPIEQVPSLCAQYRASEAAKRIAYEAPWTEAVLRLMDTPEYRSLPVHDDDFIRRRLGLTAQALHQSLTLLRDSGAVQFRDGRMVEFEPFAVDTKASPMAVTRLLSHWTEVGRHRIERRRDEDLFAYNVVSVSEADYEHIRGLLRNTFREISSIVAASEPPEKVVLLNMHWFALNGGTLD